MVVNFTGSDLANPAVVAEVSYEVVVPNGPADLDEVEQVLQVIESRPDMARLVVGYVSAPQSARRFCPR